MNAFTRFLSRKQPKNRLLPFIERWDALEFLVIETFKQKQPTAATRAEYVALRDWLMAHYPAWADQLRPKWQASRVGFEPVEQDPFLRVLKPEAVDGFVDDWEIMQHLPAAREAINQLLLEL